MSYTDKIEVTQFDNPGGMHHGKWFVSRGQGRTAQYLRKDGNWHSDTAKGDFFWEQETDANKAAEEADTAINAVLENDPTPPP